MVQQPWTANFAHPELTITQTVVPPLPAKEGEPGAVALPTTYQLAFSTANPNVQQFIQMLIQLAIQTAPIWIPLIVGDSPQPTAKQ